MLEPLLQLIPAPFDRVQFGEFRGEVPHFEVVPAYARDRTVSDSSGLALPTHELPKIPRIEVTRPIQKHRYLLPELVSKSVYKPDAVLPREIFFRPAVEAVTV